MAATSDNDSFRVPDRARTSKVASRMRSLVVTVSGADIVFTLWHTSVTLGGHDEPHGPKPPVPDRRVSAVPVAAGNPSFGLFGNTFTFLAIAFERYIVSATRQALPRITDTSVAEEADAFVRQEAQHARAHHAHAKAMIDQYPGLDETYAAANAAYDELLEHEDVEFHLAYIANLEATFTPLFKMVFDNRHELFEGSDERVGTLLLWHFVEEIEHRSSALLIHHHVTPDPWYRIRKAPKVFDHVPGSTSSSSPGSRSTFPSRIARYRRRPSGPGAYTYPSSAIVASRPRPPDVDAEQRPRPGPADDDLAPDQGPDPATTRHTNRCRRGWTTGTPPTTPGRHHHLRGCMTVSLDDTKLADTRCPSCRSGRSNFREHP